MRENMATRQRRKTDPFWKGSDLKGIERYHLELIAEEYQFDLHEYDKTLDYEENKDTARKFGYVETYEVTIDDIEAEDYRDVEKRNKGIIPPEIRDGWEYYPGDKHHNENLALKRFNHYVNENKTMALLNVEFKDFDKWNIEQDMFTDTMFFDFDYHTDVNGYVHIMKSKLDFQLVKSMFNEPKIQKEVLYFGPDEPVAIKYKDDWTLIMAPCQPEDD